MAIKLIITALAAILAVALAQPAFPVKPHLGISVPNFAPRLDIPRPNFAPRIVGGSEAKVGQFPCIVSLQYGWSADSTSHFCAGSLISARTVVTAAHCIQAVPPFGSFLVKAGVHSLSTNDSNVQTRTVAKSTVHEKYTGGVAPYDIGLLKLSEPFNLGPRVAVCGFPKRDAVPPANSRAQLAGWGSISQTSNPIMPDKLQTANFPIVDLATCKKNIEDLTGPSPLADTNICTGPLTGGYSACSGDSGGPLLGPVNADGKPQLIGVVSWGIIPCGTPGAPSVYTRVSAYLVWILTHMFD